MVRRLHSPGVAELSHSSMTPSWSEAGAAARRTPSALAQPLKRRGSANGRRRATRRPRWAKESSATASSRRSGRCDARPQRTSAFHERDRRVGSAPRERNGDGPRVRRRRHGRSLCRDSDHADEVDGTIAFASRGVHAPAIASATSGSSESGRDPGGAGARATPRGFAGPAPASAFDSRVCFCLQRGGCAGLGGA